MIKSGGILLNKEMDKVALVVRKENEYSFPKGHIDEFEDIIECAIREVTEETGYDVDLAFTDPIGINEYKHKTEGNIKVIMFLFIEKGKTTKNIDEKDKEKIEWVNINEVYDILSYQNLKDFWNSIYAKLINFIEEPR